MVVDVGSAPVERDIRDGPERALPMHEYSTRMSGAPRVLGRSPHRRTGGWGASSGHDRALAEWPVALTPQSWFKALASCAGKAVRPIGVREPGRVPRRERVSTVAGTRAPRNCSSSPLIRCWTEILSRKRSSISSDEGQKDKVSSGMEFGLISLWFKWLCQRRRSAAFLVVLRWPTRVPRRFPGSFLTGGPTGP